MGTQCPISDVIQQKNITLDSGNSRWTHATTGIYFLIVRYRQATGGDIWSVFGVTKGGNSNCVGLSARTGSENSHNEAYNIIYTVDSTSATYQLQGWSGGSKTVIRPDSQGNPSGQTMILLSDIRNLMVALCWITTFSKLEIYNEYIKFFT